jgi:hypothetical protein
MVSWSQAWITNRTSFYITRALIGAFEGGFIRMLPSFITHPLTPISTFPCSWHHLIRHVLVHEQRARDPALLVLGQCVHHLPHDVIRIKLR